MSPLIAADHGLAFEEILCACGLLPQNVVSELEIASAEVRDGTAADPGHRLRAATNYQARGYDVAVKRLRALGRQVLGRGA